MNAINTLTKLDVRVADLNDRDDARRIDAFVCTHPQGTPFHRPAWSRAVANGCGQAHQFLVVEDNFGAISGILPLTVVRSRLFGNALASVGFGVDGGILADSVRVSDALTDKAMHLATELGCPTIELRGGALPPGWDVDGQAYVGFKRALAENDEAELLAIPRKQRAEVRKALGFDLQVDIGAGLADMEAHYLVYATSVRNLGTPVFPKKLFEAMITEFGQDADILTVRHAGNPIASVLSLYHNGVVYPYWGGGISEARTWRANDLMYYALMCHARSKRGCSQFDFGRSKVGSGPASFKKNWGFEAEPLTYAKWAADGAIPREINPNSPKYQLQVKVWKKLPLWLANRVGPLVSRGLG